jgi:hypothetical protein
MAPWLTGNGKSALLPLLLAVCLVRLWLMPLPSSFWLDEMATVFVAQHGANHPSLADAAPQAWRSWYYPVVRMNGAVLGYSEVATRLPSILAMAGFLLLLAGLARRLIHPEAAWFAVFACLALPGLNYQAANARPYALGMCVFAAALLFLVRWLDFGRWRDGLLFAASAALVEYIHLLFWPSCLVFVLYAAARVARGETPLNGKRAVLVFGLYALALLPVAAQTLSLLRDVRAHVFAPLPSLWQLLRSLELTLVLGCALGAWLIVRARRGRPLPLTTTVLIAAWWLCQPILLYAFSWLTGDAVFVPRYLQLALPGAALASTAMAALFIPAGEWRRISAVFALGVFLFLGQWRQLWPNHHNSDWRAAARAVNQLQAAGEIPVICPSPFIEARPPAWRPDYPLPGFLYAHLAVYPISGKIYLFPFENSPLAESQASTLAQSRRFLIYGWLPQVTYWRTWFARRPEFATWHQRRLGPFADVDLVLFEKGSDAFFAAKNASDPFLRYHTSEMSCPYFYPVEPRASTAILPLGDRWAGVCRAVPDLPWQPDEAMLQRLCNLGYARGTCARFPSGDGPDAMRFTVSRDQGASLRIYYVLERDHHPFAHGPLDYSVASGAFVNPPAGETMSRQAQAYVESYLRRKVRRNRVE